MGRSREGGEGERGMGGEGERVQSGCNRRLDANSVQGEGGMYIVCMYVCKIWEGRHTAA